jgi:LysM repeat protein
VNSLRPLITISILGIICLLLYMKINETEPIVPAEVAEWDMSADMGNLDIGGPTESSASGLGAADLGSFDGDGTTEIVDAQSSPPEFSAAPSFESAPVFSTDTESPESSNSTPPAFAAVPSTTTTTTDLAPAQAQTTSVAASKPSDSKLPPLPALPAIAAGAAAVSQETLTSTATSVDTNVNTTTQSTPPTTPDTTSASAPTFPSFGSEQAMPSTESIEADAKTTAGQASLFSATRLAAQSALDRGELSQALLLLSDWYGDPSLSPEEAEEVQGMLSQLAGSVIYSTEHRLEPPYMVQAGEKLEDIAQKHNVPWQLLAKVNGLSGPEQLRPGQQLKVLRGPFSARINLSERKMVLMLDRRYAGQFSLDVEPTTSIEEGNWAVNQKLLTPANVGVVNSASAGASEERSILLTSTGGATNQVTILRAAGPTTPAANDPAGRVIQLKSNDVQDVYDILSLGSQVTIRR